MELYRYTKLEFALDIVENERLYLSKPEVFNDPFDCVLSTDRKSRQESARLISNYLLFEGAYNFALSNIHNISKNKEDALRVIEYGNTLKTTLKLYPRYGFWRDENKIAKEYLVKNSDELDAQQDRFKLRIERTMKDIRNETLICCLTSNKDSLLMWSHYGDSHKGVCIEFEIEPTEKDLIAVNYTNVKANYDIFTVTSLILAFEFLMEPIYDQGKEFNNKIMEPFYTKSTEWSYEKEFRYVLNVKNYERVFTEENKYYVKAPKIKSVTFGCRVDMNDSNYKKIISICEEKGIAVKFLEVSEEHYSLEEKLG